MNREQRRRAGHGTPVRQALDTLVGTAQDGGCDDCDAFTAVTLDQGIHFLNVHHDDTCPWYRARKRTT